MPRQGPTHPHESALKSGGELFIVDNSDESWKGLRYLQDWTEIASAFDIATGYFEIGFLLALDGKWQKLDQIRILMGDQATARTKQAILEGLRHHVCQKLDASLEGEKEANDLLTGTTAIAGALFERTVLSPPKVPPPVTQLHPTAETIRLMSEIDEVIAQHGGWPLK